jgi:hydroxymethylglutaryl-CoA reductase
MTSSRIVGFYDLPQSERLERLSKAAGLKPSDLAAFQSLGLSAEQADHMIENSIGVFGLPLGVGLNFVVNGREVLVPMAIEEPSVVAGASFMAKLIRSAGGFTSAASAPEMIGQMQVLDVKDLARARDRLLDLKPEILGEINLLDPVLMKLGGGGRDLEVRMIEESPIGPFLVVHIIYDVRDAMGANAVNTACEKLAPSIEKITGGRVHLRILSNLADKRLVKTSCTVFAKDLEYKNANGRTFSGELVCKGIVEAWAFAAVDPYRAATHNKGIMNGVDAVVIATGNDWRAIEAGAHAFAARDGRYTSLSTWSRDANGNLTGELEMPMAVGIVGGATNVHPSAKASLKLMDIKSAAELAGIIASVGLAQNLAALRALATEGIQPGHMSLHARQVATAAGATGDQIEVVAAQMVAEKTVRIDRAEEILNSLKSV